MKEKQIMNTQLAFTFGVLAMIAITTVIVIVVGIVKVIKHGKLFKQVQEEINNLHRYIASVESSLYSEFKDVDRKIDNAYTNARDMSNTYTDSRIDKLEQKLTGKKQILKD